MNKIDFKALGFLRNPSEDHGVEYAYVYSAVPSITLTKSSKKEQQFITDANGQRKFVEYTNYDFYIRFNVDDGRFSDLSRSRCIRMSTNVYSIDDIFKSLNDELMAMLEYAASGKIHAITDESRIITFDEFTDEERAWAVDYEFGHINKDEDCNDSLFDAFYEKFDKALAYKARRQIRTAAEARIRNNKSFKDLDGYDQLSAVENILKALNMTSRLNRSWGDLTDKRILLNDSRLDLTEDYAVSKLPDSVKDPIIALVKDAVIKMAEIQNQAVRAIRTALDIDNEIVA